MFDPKEIYRELNFREIIDDPTIRYEIQLKDWPADDIAYIRVFTPDGRNGWVLIAPNSTTESVEKNLRGVVEYLKRSDPSGF